MTAEFDFTGQKVMISGLQGSGKTHKGKQIVKPKQTLVFSPHEHDWNDMPDNIFFWRASGYNKQELEKFLAYAKKLTERKQIDGVLIDEFDMYIKGNFDIGPMLNDLILNHRHWGRKQGNLNGCFLIALTRRPADVPTKMYESSKFLICFAMEGANAKRKFDEIYSGMGQMITELNYDQHEYLWKEIGKPPQKVSPNGPE